MDFDDLIDYSYWRLFRVLTVEIIVHIMFLDYRLIGIREFLAKFFEFFFFNQITLTLANTQHQT